MQGWSNVIRGPLVHLALPVWGSFAGTVRLFSSRPVTKSNASATYLELSLQLLFLPESSNLGITPGGGVPRIGCREVVLIFSIRLEELRIRLAK